MKSWKSLMLWVLAGFLVWGTLQKIDFDQRPVLYKRFLSADKDSSAEPVRAKEEKSNKMRAFPPPTSDRG